jgi:hypothetical protein
VPVTVKSPDTPRFPLTVPPPHGTGAGDPGEYKSKLKFAPSNPTSGKSTIVRVPW